MDIGTGAGLAGATGVRPFLPPLLAGALARADTGIDFDGTDWSFLESPVFLAVVLGLGVAAYLIERTGAGPQAPEGRSPVELFAGIVGIVLGALLFAGALADGGEESWLGLCSGRSARRSAGSRWAGSSSAPGAASRAAPPRC